MGAPGDSRAFLTLLPFQNLAEGFLSPTHSLSGMVHAGSPELPTLFLQSFSLVNRKWPHTSRLPWRADYRAQSFGKVLLQPGVKWAVNPRPGKGDKGGACERNSASKLPTSLSPRSWSWSLEEEMRREGGGGTDGRGPQSGHNRCARDRRCKPCN